MTPAKVLAKISGRDKIELEDIQESDQLFFDAKASAKLLADEDSKYLH
jgi:RuvB-like protein 1 (pontin 52)